MRDVSANITNNKLGWMDADREKKGVYCFYLEL